MVASFLFCDIHVKQGIGANHHNKILKKARLLVDSLSLSWDIRAYENKQRRVKLAVRDGLPRAGLIIADS